MDKNGKKRNTAYESDVEYTGFFVEWIKFYLPEDPEQRSRAWELALLPSKERNPQFPGGSEYKTLKILWSAEKPLMKKEIKAERGMPETIDRLLEKKGLWKRGKANTGATGLCFQKWTFTPPSSGKSFPEWTKERMP